MIKKIVIFLNYRHFEKKFRSVIVSQNHYINKIFDVHSLGKKNKLCSHFYITPNFFLCKQCFAQKISFIQKVSNFFKL